jgi:hypothetical protein
MITIGHSVWSSKKGGRVSVQFNLFSWLFTDPITAGSSLPSGEEQFHYFWSWMIFCCVGLLVCFYYWVEARKRFVKDKPWLKYMLDRYLNWLAIICFVGIPIDLARVALDPYFFAWRIWRYLWLLAMAVWVVLWAIHLLRRYPAERAYYIAQRKRSQYMPKPSSKHKAKAAAR